MAQLLRRKVYLLITLSLIRNWALYLGRPYSIKLEDVSVQGPGSNTETPSWDMLMAEAWTSLLDIVGHVCDAL